MRSDWRGAYSIREVEFPTADSPADPDPKPMLCRIIPQAIYHDFLIHYNKQNTD